MAGLWRQWHDPKYLKPPDLARAKSRFTQLNQTIAVYGRTLARRLHHSRELGEPFDFLTWFEYAPEYADTFEELVHRLRSTVEWRYVEREVDIRLVR